MAALPISLHILSTNGRVGRCCGIVYAVIAVSARAIGFMGTAPDVSSLIVAPASRLTRLRVVGVGRIGRELQPLTGTSSGAEEIKQYTCCADRVS